MIMVKEYIWDQILIVENNNDNIAMCSDNLFKEEEIVLHSMVLTNWGKETLLDTVIIQFFLKKGQKLCKNQKFEVITFWQNLKF